MVVPRSMPCMVVLILAASACIHSPSKAAGRDPVPTTSVPSQIQVEEYSSDASVGSIVGLVLDDEAQAIKDAAVGILGLDARLRTGESGEFRFDGVPIGPHVVQASALGYESATLRIHVEADVEVEARLLLAAAGYEAPYVEAVPRTIRIPYGVGGWYGQSALACAEGCEWTLDVKAGLGALIVEFFGRHTTPSPLFGDGLTVQLFKNVDGEIWFCPGIPEYDALNDVDCRLPIRANFTADELAAAAPIGKPMQSLRSRIACEYGWVCVDERYEEWVSLFYGYAADEVPADYSAKPAS